MNRPVRVLVLTKSLYLAGAEQLITSLATSRDRTQFDYEVAYVLVKADSLVCELRSSGIPVHCLGARGNLDLSWIARLRLLLQQRHYNVMHTHLPYASSLGRLAVRSLPAASRPRLVSTAHIDYDRLAVPTRFLEWVTYHLDDRVISVSEATRCSLPALARARAETIIHGIDRTRVAQRVDRARGLRSALPGAPSDVLIVSVANLRPQKNYPMLLESARMLLDRDLPFQVLAVGAGPAREELEAMRDRLGLQGRVHFLGRRFDAVEITAASDIFVLTSDYEGLPVAVMEAMTVGTPVVVTAVGELPHIVNEGRTGRLVAPGDTAALTGCLEELIENPDQRASLAKAARQASPRFEIQRATRRIETVYAELASLESH